MSHIRTGSRPGSRPSARSAGRILLLVAGLLVTLLVPAHRAFAQALSPGGPVDFGPSPVGVSAGKISLNFNAVVTTDISAINIVTEGAANQDFSLVSQSCVGIQAPPASCLITMQFTPSSPGLRRGWLSVLDSSGAIVNNVPLRGIGQGPLMVLTSPLTATATASFAGLLPAGFSPTGMILDGSGNLYFNDIANSRLLEQSAGGAVSTVGTVAGTSLSSLAINGFGTVFVSSPAQGVVFGVSPGGSPLPIATPGVTLRSPTGLAVDGSGYLYIADSATNAIVRITADGTVASTLTLTGLATPLLRPSGLTVDSDHNLYIADSGNNRIVRFSLLTGKAAPLAVSGLTLSEPAGITISPSGTLTVADAGNTRFLSIAADGTATPLDLGSISTTQPTGALMTPNGELLLSDLNSGLITVPRKSASLTYPTPTAVGSLDSPDGNLSVTVANDGNAPLQIDIPASGYNPSQTGVAFDLGVAGSTCPVVSAGAAPSAANQLAADASCLYEISFTPLNTGINASTVTVGGQGIGGYAPTSVSVNLKGTGISKLARFIVVATPSVTTVGGPVTLTVTAIDTTGQVYTGYLGRIIFTSTDSTASFPGGNAYVFTAADQGVHTFSAPGSGVTFGTVGTWTVSVADNAYTGTSNPVQVIAQPIATGSTLSASPNPVLLGGTVTLTATVASGSTSVSTTPTGSVQFMDGGATLGTATVANGTASLQVTLSTAGSHQLSAVYSGDGTFASSTGVTTEQVVDFTLTLAPNGSGTATVFGGSPASYSLVLTPVGASTLPAATAFTLLGLPSGSNYTMSPISLATGSATTPVTLTVTTIPNVPTLVRSASIERHEGGGRGSHALMSLAMLALLAPLARRRRGAHRLLSVLFLLGAMAALTGLTGCLSSASSGYYDGTPVTSTLTVSATAGGSLTHSVNLTLTVE